MLCQQKNTPHFKYNLFPFNSQQNQPGVALRIKANYPTFRAHESRRRHARAPLPQHYTHPAATGHNYLNDELPPYSYKAAISEKRKKKMKKLVIIC
jgi:hypothetical protein